MNERTIDIGALDLADGGRIERVEQHVTWYGHLQAERVAFVPHALTGNSRVTEWWGGLAGEGAPLDPRDWCVIGINALGSCYGSTGPSNHDRFPHVGVRDLVRAQARALDALGVARLSLVIGASLGGMQALQWALDYPHRVACAVVVGAHDHQSAMGIALNAIQRDCIALDSREGIGIARKIAMLSYKSDALLRMRHDRRADRNGRFRYDVEGYLDYQATRFRERMDPRSYVALTHTMDSFDVRSAATLDTSPRLLFIGISSDWLFLPSDVKIAADRFSARGFDTRYFELQSDHGHDAFLAEPHALATLLAPELARLR